MDLDLVHLFHLKTGGFGTGNESILEGLGPGLSCFVPLSFLRIDLHSETSDTLTFCCLIVHVLLM